VEELLEEQFPGALAYARRHADPMILHQESCTDIVQSVCRDVWVRRNEFEWRGLPAFRKLLYQKVLSKLIDRKLFYQRDKRDVRRQALLASASGPSPLEQIPAAVTSPSEAAMCGEDLLRFRRCFAKLPADYQRVIRRSRLEGRTHAEIAEEFDREPGAVKVLLHRALIKLGLLIDDDARETRD
jgi:RNA polymerase sigma-70 factor, ECF subfamily